MKLRDSTAIFRDFCKTTTIHGPAYLAEGHVLKRILWTVVIAVTFSVAAILIRDAINEWDEQPVVMNFGLQSLPITDVPVSARPIVNKIMESTICNVRFRCSFIYR